jgi:DNA-binding NtrC family response regulator
MEKKKKILVCDDEEGVRESMKLILEDKYDLALATDGNECLNSLKSDPDIALVLMDIKMPRMNGLEVLKKIKVQNPQMNVIIVTGYRSVETAQEAIKVGAGDYVIKPFASKDILEAVAKYLP